MKKLILLLIFISTAFLLNAQTIVKGSGVLYATAAPTDTINVNYHSELAIDTSTGYWYEFQRDSNKWVKAGFRIQETNSVGAPTYTPGDKQSLMVINNGDSLYHYRSGSWRLVSGGGGGADTQDLSITGGGGTIRLVDGGFVVLNDSSSTNEIQNLSWDRPNHQIDISLGGTSATIPLANTDGDTLGLATFEPADFNDDNNGTISIDYTFGQKATLAVPGFLSAGDWVTFNNKNSGIQFLDEGVVTGPIKTINEIDFVGGNVTASNVGNKITVTITDADTDTQDISITAGKGTINLVDGGSITLGDSNSTNEIQYLDTFLISGNYLKASLLNDNKRLDSVSLSAYLDNTDAQALSITAGKGYVNLTGSTGIQLGDSSSVNEGVLSLAGSSNALQLVSNTLGSNTVFIHGRNGNAVTDSLGHILITAPAAGSSDGNGIYSGDGDIPDETYAKVSNGQLQYRAFAIGTFPAFPNINSDAREMGLIFDPLDETVYLMGADSTIGKYSYLSAKASTRLAASNTAISTYSWLESFYDNVEIRSTSGSEVSYQYVRPDSITLISDQVRINADSLHLKINGSHGTAGQVLTATGGDNATWQTPAAGSDDQKIDTFSLGSNLLKISLESDGEAAKQVDLSGYLDNTDSQNLTIEGSGPTYDIAINGGTDVTISGGGIVTLSESPANTLVITATEVDGSITNEIQYPDTFNIVGNYLKLSLINDGRRLDSVNLSSYLDNTDAQTLDVFSTSGNVISASISNDGEATKTANIINSNSNSISGNIFTGSVNGQSDTSLIIGTHIVNLSGNQIASNTNGVSDTTLVIGTNSLSSSTNTMTSSVNGVSSNGTIINSISNTSSVNNLSTTVNGITGSNVNIINSNVLNLSGNTLTETINGQSDTSLVIGTNVMAFTADSISVTVNGVQSNKIYLPNVADTDNQTIDTFSLNTKNIWLSLQDDGEAKKVLYLGMMLDTATNHSGDVSGIYSNLQLGAGVVGTTELADSSVTAIKVISNSIDGVQLKASGVTAGSYVFSNITVDNDGRITTASSGAEVDGSITNEIQYVDTFLISGNYLKFSLLNDNKRLDSISLASYLDNTDAQTLSWNGATGEITISGGNTIDIDGRYLTAEVDGSISNEGSLTVNAGSGTTSVISSNTSGSTDVTITAGTGISISESGNNITLASSITQYTDEQAQDAIGAMIDASLNYVDGTPLLQRAALTGDVTATAGSNATTIANDAVTTAKILNSTIATADLADSLITGAKVVSNSIDGTQLKASGVTAGSYTFSSLTIDNDGRVTSASNGTEVDGSTTNEAFTIDGDDADTEVISNQTLKFEGAGIITTDYVPASDKLIITGTEVDGSTTNEIQYADTFLIASNYLKLSLLNDNRRLDSVSLSPYLDNTDSQSFSGSDDGTTFTLDLSGAATDISFKEGTGVTITRTGTELTFASSGSFTTEDAQDAVGAMINASLQYVDGTPLLAIGDRDNGDITTSGSGLTWTIDNGTISTAKLADSAVTEVKLISNAVGTTALASSSVTTLKIAANAIDGTKIAFGSDAQGDIAHYDGTDWVRLAAGTSGHYLKTQGAGANPVWAAVAGISDGDKGDITVSSSGTVWTVDNLAITNAKINDVAWSKITSTPTTLSGYGITDALSNSTSSTQDGYFGNINLKDDTSPSHYLTITDAENLTADRILSLSVNDAARSISLSGNLTVSSSATISGTNTGDQTITLTGDVTGSGTGSFAATVADNSVDGTDIALGSDAQGDVMYYDGTNWVKLAAGTNGHFLKTQGAGANPTWAAGSADGNGIYSGQGRIPDMTYAKVGLNQANPDAFLIGNFTDSTELQYNARERGLLFSQSTNNVYLVKSDSANANYSLLTLSDRGSLTSSNTAGTKYTTVDIYGNASNNYFILESYNDPEQTYVRGSADSLFIRTDQIRIDVDTFSLKIGGSHGTSGQVLTSNGGSIATWQTPGSSFTTEDAQDAVGAMVNASLTYVDGTPLLSIADRDNGDITVSASGLTWTIDNAAIAWGEIASGTVADNNHLNVVRTTDFTIGWFPSYPSVTSASRGLWLADDQEVYLYANDSVTGNLARLYSDNGSWLLKSSNGTDESYLQNSKLYTQIYTANVSENSLIFQEADSTTIRSQAINIEADSLRFVVGGSNGTSGQVLKSDGKKMYWAADNDTGGGGGVSDGDKGDITVSSGGATWSIDNGVITTGKYADSSMTIVKMASNSVGVNAITANSVDASELISTAVTPGSYTFASITVDADGRLTSASSGTGSQLNGSLADSTYSGTTISGTLGETVLFGELVYLKSDGKWWKTKADAEATSSNKLAICVYGGVANDVRTFLLNGNVRKDSAFPTGTIGSAAFISASTFGQISTTAPSGTTDYVVRVVCFFNTADEIYFNPSNDYVILN